MDYESLSTVHPLTLSRFKPYLTAFSPDDQAGGGGNDNDTPSKDQDQPKTGDQDQLTSEQQQQLTEYERHIEARTLKKIEAAGYELSIGKDNSLEIVKKGQKSEPDKQTPVPPSQEETYSAYAAEMRAIYAQAGLDPPTDKEIKTSYVKEVHRIRNIGALTKKQIQDQIAEAMDSVYGRLDKDDREKWFSGERAFLKELEADVLRALSGEGSAKDIDKIVKAAVKHGKESVQRERAGDELRAKLETEGFMETGGKRGTTAPSLSTVEKAQAFDKDIRKATSEGKISEVNALVNKRRRLFAE